MAEKKIIELEVKNNLGSLKSQLREAQAEVAKLSEQFGATSREAANAAKKAAELKDQIEDAKALTDAFNPDAKFKAVSAALGGVASGFAAYQGALGLVGVESKAVEEQLLKVQSAAGGIIEVPIIVPNGAAETSITFDDPTYTGVTFISTENELLSFIVSANTTGLPISKNFLRDGQPYLTIYQDA